MKQRKQHSLAVAVLRLQSLLYYASEFSPTYRGRDSARYRISNYGTKSVAVSAQAAIVPNYTKFDTVSVEIFLA